MNTALPLEFVFTSGDDSLLALEIDRVCFGCFLLYNQPLQNLVA